MRNLQDSCREALLGISSGLEPGTITQIYFLCFAAGGIRPALSFGGVTAVKKCPVAQTLAAA